MDYSATLALIIQFLAGCIATFLVLRQVVGFLIAVLIGTAGTTIGGILLPRWLTGLPEGDLHLMITSVVGALIVA